MNGPSLDQAFSRLTMKPDKDTTTAMAKPAARREQQPVYRQQGRPHNARLPNKQNKGNVVPAIPQSQEVKKFIKEPSYSTILLQPVLGQGKVDQPVSVQVNQPIYANTGNEQEQKQALYYPSPPSPVSSSYSELRQATRIPLGYHIQQHMKQQQLTQNPPTIAQQNYDSLYEPVQQQQQSSSLYAVSGDIYKSSSSSSSSSGDGGYGNCAKCRRRIVGEGNGCEAMGWRYHVGCFTCHVCGAVLQGQPFYALDGKPHCTADYLETLEKCCKCLTPICDRILRASGKPYHPQCFACVECRRSLDRVPFTVDAANRVHCIPCFHRRYAPKCSVCREPIMPLSNQEEGVRVVALDRSFHVGCFCCEDCGLRLSSEAEGGAGCYPLDNHVLCKECSTRRIQALMEGIK